MSSADPPNTFLLEFLPATAYLYPFPSGPHRGFTVTFLCPWADPLHSPSWMHAFLDAVTLPCVVSLQLVPYWEKTFDIDLTAPQIGVVNVTDVSFLPARPAGPSSASQPHQLSLLGGPPPRPPPQGQTRPVSGLGRGRGSARSTHTAAGSSSLKARSASSPDLPCGVRPPPRRPQSPFGVANGTSARLALRRACLSGRLSSLRAEIALTHGRCFGHVCGGEGNKPQSLRSYRSQ